MELAKVTSKGQITIPIEIRKKLGIKEGSKVLFLEEAERLGLETEEDVMTMVKELRKKRAVK